MIDIQHIKEVLTIDDIFLIMEKLDIPISQHGKNFTIYYSKCHHLHDYLEHKPKLYLYHNTMSFFCYSCSTSFDIFELVKKLKNYNFISAVNFIIDVCSLKVDKLQTKEQKNRDFWEKDLNRFLKSSNSTTDVKTYDKRILNIFDEIYHQSWIDDGISIETQEKFGIKLYQRTQQITIPVYDVQSNLIGVHGRNLLPHIIERGYKYLPVQMLDGLDLSFPTSKALYGIHINKFNIQKNKEAFIFEAPKSVLQMEDICKEWKPFLNENCSLGNFGMSFQKYKRDLLLKQGVETINICLDKQYHQIDDDEFNKWLKDIFKMVDMLKPFFKIYIIYDTNNLLDYKDSPSDKGLEVWNELYENRELMN